VEKLSIHEIIKIIKKQFLIQQQSLNSSIEQITQWLLCLNYSLEQMKYLNDIDDDTIQLKELKMIPIENQPELVSPNEMIIFFPDITQTEFRHVDQKLIKLLNDLPTVKVELFHYIEQNYPDRLQDIKELLKKFGIIEKRYDEVYRLSIKPVFENETMWKAKDSEVLIMYLVYVYEHIHQKGYPHENDFDIDDFKNIVQIKCRNNEFYNPMKTIIHLLTTDDFNDGIRRLLKPTNCVFMSDEYSNYLKKDEKNQWYMFLERLDQLRETPWEHYEEELREDYSSTKGYVIHDFTCPEFIEIFEYINDGSYTALSSIDIRHMNENDNKQRINVLLDNPPRLLLRRTFIESISTMNRLYHFLHHELSNDKRYMKWPLVFLPDSPISKNTDLCIGQFLFINEVAWDDPTHLLPEHNFIKSLYPDLENFFKHVLQIPSTPNAKCYLELLEKYSKENITDQQTENIWKIFDNLNDEDNDSIIKLFRYRYLIPSMTEFGWIKLDDEPYVPDDKIVAQLFESERLPIIKLPEYGLTTNGRKFLDKLQCKNFSEVLISNVNITNEKLSDDLRQFYIKTLPFISNYLYNQTDMFDESYDKRKLNEIFSHMKFFNVNSIQVTYRYKQISFDHDYDCYLDKKSKKFYLLNTQRYSQSIDTMIQFIIDDTVAECHYKRNKLDKYYKKLLIAYSRNQLEQYMIDDHDSSKPIWIIDIDNSDESDDSEDEANLVENINNQDSDEKIVSNSALADKILNEEKILIPKSKSKQKRAYQQYDTNVSNSNTDIGDKASKSIEDSNTSNDDQSTNNRENEGHRKENVSIKWLNENGETGLPYDIEINFIDNSQDTQRIEVKTTSKHIDNYQFSISIQEVQAMLRYPNTYYIYRVNLNNRSLTIIDNITQNLTDKRQLQLQMNVLTFDNLNEK
ncbi:unnamed protein product, partial [Rotaria sordida]